MGADIERRDIFWYIVLRFIIVTTILVSALVLQFAGEAVLPIVPVFYLVGLAYLMTLFCFILYLRGMYPGFQAYVQLAFDLLLITALVYVSGGVTSSMYFLYVFAIIAASLVISARAAYLAASFSAILFGLLVDGMYFGLVPYFSPEHDVNLTLGSIVFTMLVAWAVFFIIAFLTNYLSGSLRRTREQLRRAQNELVIKERLAEAGRVAATVAHEIRNPLAAISGSVQVLRDDPSLAAERRELMDIVVRESERVSRSIDQFLDFAAPTREPFAEVNLSDLLDETLTMLRSSGELNGKVGLAGNHAATSLRTVGHAGQFKQVFWNLAKNAVKAMPDGGTLTIDLEKDRKSLRIRFADTGKGMSAEDKAHLFEPFYSGFGNGRGLGMAGVRRIVDDYEGTIDVRSELGHGTEIIITLPCKRAQARGGM